MIASKRDSLPRTSTPGETASQYRTGDDRGSEVVNLVEKANAMGMIGHYSA